MRFWQRIGWRWRSVVRVGDTGILLDLSQPVFTPRIRKRIRRGKYELLELKAALALIEPGQTVLELGAGCGFVSAGLLKSGKPGRVICVEANPKLIPVIKHHHRLNGVCCEVFNEALGPTVGTRSLFVHSDFWASSTLAFSLTNEISVPMSSWLDRLAEWKPDLIVMDIEGGEDELLPLGLPDYVRAVVIETHEWAYGVEGVERVMDRLSSFGFALEPDHSYRNVLAYRRSESSISPLQAN